MKTAIFNFLARRAGAYLSPVIAAGLSAGFTWLALHTPVLGPWIAEENVQTEVVGLLFGAIMVWVNWLTTMRGFKYGQIVQKAMNTIGFRYGLTVDPDGVIGPVTAENAALVVESVKEARVNRGEPAIAPPIDGIDFPSTSRTPSAQRVGNPNGKG